MNKPHLVAWPYANYLILVSKLLKENPWSWREVGVMFIGHQCGPWVWLTNGFGFWNPLVVMRRPSSWARVPHPEPCDPES